ncbi:MAG: FtsX-like permease family protein [Luteitalea sp.]|nr:FtsX-like permease family protein [Luteitalea sp.]
MLPSEMKRLLGRLCNVWRTTRAERQAAKEISSHLTLLEDDFCRRGMTPEQARVAARRALGGVDQAKELHRDARSFVWLEDARRDIQHALRTLARNPGFTLAAVLTLAIGIGGSSAVFSLINAVLLRPLPFHEPERLVMIWEDASEIGFPRNDVAPANYDAWARENKVFDSVAAASHWGVTLAGSQEPEKIQARGVTAAFFPVLGVTPALGRVFRPDEDRPGGPAVTVLSHELWQQRFGGDPTIIGRDILLNNEPYTVVGIMPATFQFLESYVGLWVPAAFSSEELAISDSHYLTVVARLKPGVSVARAQANIEAINARIARDRPAEARGLRAHILPLAEQVSGDARRPLLLLLTAVGVVLSIACANLAGLLLARAASRRHEIALRSALGAARGRIVRQLLTESLVLSAMGLLLGLVLARWTFTFLEQLVPPDMTLFASMTLDARTFGLTVAVSLMTGVLCGLAPAVQTTRSDVSTALRASGRTASRMQRSRSVLVVAEVAMTLVLLVAAGMLMQALYRLRYADVGLRTDGVLTLRTALATHPDERGIAESGRSFYKYTSHTRRTAFYDEVLGRITHLPGVAAAGYTTSVPLEWRGGTTSFVLEGKPPDPAVAYDANHRQVSAGYFRAIGVPLRRGRYFDAGDNAGAQPVAIVNETMARQYWPADEVVGKRFKPDAPGYPGPWLTIVGVVGDVRQMGLDAPVKAEMYVPYRQFDAFPWFAPRDLVVRTVVDPMSLVSSITHEIHAVDPAQPVSNIRTLNEILDEDVAARRVGTTLLIAFAAFALLLAVVGIYGVIAYFVVQHVPEIGVRIALGAQARDILMLVVVKGMKLTLMGIGVGAVAAIVATRLMSGLLYGLTGWDPTTIVFGSVLLILLALIASYLPARKATKLDPIVALRSE